MNRIKIELSATNTFSRLSVIKEKDALATSEDSPL